MSEIVFAVGGDSMGTRQVYVTDEHGCLLHTEPVCTYDVRQHPWFEKWIQEQDVPASYPTLLWHPALGETAENYQHLRNCVVTPDDPLHPDSCPMHPKGEQS